MIKSKIDFEGALEGLDKLLGPGRESLGRQMAVAAGRVYRSEAERNVPVGKSEWNAQAQFGGSKNAGLLKDSLYVAFNAKASTDTVFVYSVSWNRERAPHGHLVEFGHWRPYAIVFSSRYGWRTDKTRKLPGMGVWVPAHPFLSVAYHSGKAGAVDAATNAGRQALPRILQGQTE